ncbi:dUTP diphosphatase [Candidatus Contubernalis alkaliaceticus]|uniref:dUTP diphosphatase n=1 Tax=Candidatus Contubernalis alkaliaceticus TaxID=338645 RepID=UPI001F4BF97E|nr:dUTP diphosphatase [Candidatus Contubernalis alkalaceticus]UNC91847.1 dUTP diphosphatase [Candidatus Contubernalis alkalaceticus]
MDKIVLKIVQLKEAQDLPLPDYASPGSAGMDLRAALTEEFILQPGEYTLVPTGLIIEIPENFEGQVRPRSGLALKHGITLLNSPGTIDSDYRGEVKVILINLGKEPYVIKRGDRIAQLVLVPVSRAQVVKSGQLSNTSRGEGGFGHSGVE